MKLSIRNFKMIKSLDIEINGDSLIRGAHDSGKTTIADAIMWAVIGSNLYGTPSFEPKPIDKDGNIIDLKTSVSLTIRDIEFKKETFYKKDSNGEVTGNNINYYVNSVLSRKSDYDAEIFRATGMSGDLLLVTMNPRAFSETLSVSKRRDMLYNIAGRVSKEEILDKMELNNKEYVRSVIDLDLYKHSSSLTSMINKSKSNMKSLSDLVLELTPDVSDFDFSPIEKEIISNENKIASIEKEIEALKSNSSSNPRIDAIVEKRDLVKKEGEEIALKIKTKESLIKKSIQDDIDFNKSEISILNDRIVSLREEASKIGSLEILVENCPTCSQEYPSDKKDEIIKRQELDKKTKFNKIKEEGVRVKEIIEQRTEKDAHLSAKENEIIKHNESLKADIASLSKALEEKRMEYKSIVVPEKESFSFETYENEISSIRDKNRELLKRLDAKVISDYAQKKIGESNILIKKTREEIIDLSAKKKACDDFSRYLVSFINDSVNSLFKTVKFTMFEETFTGEPKEVCDPKINGVPYNQLNGRGKVIVAKEISELIASHYGNSMITIIDQRESAQDVVISTGNSLMLQAVKDFTPNVKLSRIDGGVSDLEILKN